MKKRGKGQVSMEYMAIFSIAVLMTLPLIIIFVTQQGNIKADITNAQAQRAATEIISAAEEVYFMGPPAQRTIRVTFPEGIQGIDISQTTFMMSLTTAELDYMVIKDSAANMTGNLSITPGQKTIVLRAEAAQVIITDAE
jgi:uncharacterized protein (UPF0333 family)